MINTRKFLNPGRIADRWMAQTGMHGIPNIKAARSRWRKVFWCVLLLAASAMCGVQLYDAIEKLKSFPTSTTQSILHDDSITFPSVTICNINPIHFGRLVQVAKLENSSSNLRELLKITGQENIKGFTVDGSRGPLGAIAASAAPSIASVLGAGKGIVGRGGRVVQMNPTPPAPGHWEARMKGTVRNDVQVTKRFLHYMNALTDDELASISPNLEYLMLDCEFQGTNCHPDQFLRFRDHIHGFCYIFNSGYNKSSLPVKIGTVAGSSQNTRLDMTLHIDQANYVPTIITKAGAKVVIHDRFQYPFPSSQGIEVAPGIHSAISIQLHILERTAKPYGNCLNFTDSQNRAKNMYIQQLPFVKSCENTCINTCRQLMTLTHCGCQDLSLGFFPKAEAFSSVNVSQRETVCSLNMTEKDGQCKKLLTQTVNDVDWCTRIFCDKDPCIKVKYPIVTSYSQWPAEGAFTSLIDLVLSHPDPELRKTFKGLLSTTAVREYISKNFLSFTVFFEDLNFKYIKIEGSYDAMDFLSDLGGITGLWLGFSILTFFEFVEMIFEVIRVLIHLPAHRAHIKKAKKHVERDDNGVVHVAYVDSEGFKPTAVSFEKHLNERDGRSFY